MSEGVENSAPADQFWKDRAWMVLDAVVASGAVPIDPAEYEAEKRFYARYGFTESEVASTAFRMLMWRPPSVCEVNPW